MAFDLLEYAKRVAVRRVVAILVVSLLSWAGLARAQDRIYESREAAYAACRAWIDTPIEGRPYVSVDCEHGFNVRWRYSARKCNKAGGTSCSAEQFAYDQECPANSDWDDESKTCSKDCASESSPSGNASYSGVTESLYMCFNGCMFRGQGVCVSTPTDGEMFTACGSWSNEDFSCEAGEGEGEERPDDSDEDGTSDGNDPAPNNPGEGGGGKDGQPGQDGSGGDGPGEGSGNGNKSGGGGNCSTPPSSTGDAILAQIAYQTWATRCAAEALVEGGTGAGGTGAGGTGDGDGSDSSAVEFDQGDPAEDDGDAEPGEVATHTFDIESMLDFSGFAGGGSCPEFGSIEMGPFGTHSLGGDWFCEWLPVFRTLIILMAVGTAIKILLGYNA